MEASRVLTVPVSRNLTTVRLRTNLFFCAAGLSLAPGCHSRTDRTKAPDSGGTGGTQFVITTLPTCPDASIDAGAHVPPALDGATCVPGRTVSYTADVVPIFARNCATGEICHQGAWDGPNAAEFLVGIRASECCDGRELVQPGNPARSYLIEKLRGVDLCTGVQMPAGGTLPSEDLATLEDWICEGAPNE